MCCLGWGRLCGIVSGMFDEGGGEEGRDAVGWDGMGWDKIGYTVDVRVWKGQKGSSS